MYECLSITNGSSTEAYCRPDYEQNLIAISSLQTKGRTHFGAD